MNYPTVSLPVMNNNASTNDPTDRQDQPPPMKKSRIDTSSKDPKYRGRGFTDKPRGRPLGALNKPKVPKDDQPKLPKKRGRPPGAQNKFPRRARTPKPPAPTGDRSPVDGGRPQPPLPVADDFSPVFSEPVRTYQIPEYIPNGYVPADSILPARHPPPDDIMTPLFSDPPANLSPYIDPRLFGHDHPVPGFGNLIPSSKSPEENNNDFTVNPALLNNQYLPVEPALPDNQNSDNDLALLDNQYFDNDPIIFDRYNNNNNNGSSSGGDIEAESFWALQ